MTRISRAQRTARTLDPRVLQLKIRIRAPRGTTRAELLEELERAMHLGYLSPGWAVSWVDWRKGEGRHENTGQLSGDLVRELRVFYDAITSPATQLRVERAT